MAMADVKHVLSHVNFNGDSIDIQDAVARQAASDLADEISELAKNAVTNVAQGLTDYTIRVTKDGLAIDVPIKGLSSKLDELAQAIEDAKTDVSLDSPKFTGTPTVPTADGGSNTTQIANTAFVQSELTAHNTSTTSHQDIRTTLTELVQKVNGFLDSDNTDLDTLNDIITYIQANRSSIETLTTDKINVSDIVDGLSSTDSSKVLSAKQGNALKALIDAISTSISNVDNTSDANKPVSTAQQTAIDAAYENATKYADTKIADLIDGAPETMDTLKEVAEAIQANKDVETALDEAIGKKANQVELDTHVNNTTIHITASERANYQTAYEHSQAKHARADATKVEKSTTNGNILIDGVESNVYSHPGTGTNPHGTTKADIGLKNVGNFKAVSTVANQGLTDDEKAAARTNIGAQIAGSYASSTHNHDDKYQAKGSYASASHTHDDRYYTESEMNTKLGGKVDLSADGVSNAINKLSIGTATPSDADYYVSQYISGGGTKTTYHRRPVSALWAYIKSKADKVYATLTHTHTKSQITDFPTSLPANGGDADHATRLVCEEKRPTSANKASSSDRAGMMEMFLASSSMTTGKPSADAKILQMNWDNTTGWDSQLAMLNSGTLQHRNMSSGKWQDWKTVLDSSNYKTQIGFETGSWNPIPFDTASHEVDTTKGGVTFGLYYRLGDIVFIESMTTLVDISYACHHIGGLPYEPNHVRPSNMYPIGIVSGDNSTNSPFNPISGRDSFYVQNGSYSPEKTCTTWYVYGWYRKA